ncbi:hypothetical protein CTEN210_18575 [Chaetoceros tenuissimus]|uniref:SET domain-containing protein n=1 Tax=Chaetoceros tenuissimus TaxID=426638 RepID=A0AAD3DG89_9STRA|nr:hypothetical protein CTEN210_18575 [Chaetoceros tenuissimus]
MKYSSCTLLCLVASVEAFSFKASSTLSTPHQQHQQSSSSSLFAGGEGGESEWAKALQENTGQQSGLFDKELQQLQSKKLQGLSSSAKSQQDSKLSANAKLIQWLEQEGDVYLQDASGWGEAPHPMAISTETVDELTNESSGRGLLARRNINQEEELLKIPLSLCITKKSARKTLGTDVLPPNINEYLVMACQLIHEKYVMGDESYYKSYIDVLPEVDEVNPTFTWSDDDLQFLDGSPVIAATKSMQMKLKSEYNMLLADEGKLCDQYPDIFPRDKFTYEAWVWAFTNLFSRAIRLRNMKQGETLAMVPYADLINHSPYSGAYLDARETGDWLFKTGGEEVILYADRGYRRMEQIYISYGPKSNADLLLLYGFALERNPFNSVDVTVSIAPRTKELVQSVLENVKENPEFDMNAEIDPLAQEKLDFLDRAGRSNTVDFPCYADRYPTEMLEYLRLMMMTPEDTMGKPLRDFDYTRTISAANEAAVLYSVVEAVKGQLERYPTTEEDDAAIIKDRGMFKLLSYNQRMAVRHRRNEKRLLKRTIAALEKQIKTRGLDVEDLKRAEGSTLGTVLPGEERRGQKQRTALEDRLDKMGLPVDLR